MKSSVVRFTSVATQRNYAKLDLNYAKNYDNYAKNYDNYAKNYDNYVKYTPSKNPSMMSAESAHRMSEVPRDYR